MFVITSSVFVNKDERPVAVGHCSLGDEVVRFRRDAQPTFVSVRTESVREYNKKKRRAAGLVSPFASA